MPTGLLRYVLLAHGMMLGSALCAQGTMIVGLGATITNGAILSQVEYPPEGYGVLGWEGSPAQGYGMQFGLDHVLGPDSLAARFGIGFRLHFRNYRETTLTEEYRMQPSSFYSTTDVYDGVLTIREMKFAIPMSVWLRLGGRSKLNTGVEFQVASARSAVEEGTLTTVTTHYTIPGYDVESISTTEGPYKKVIDPKSGLGYRFAFFLGYRFRLNERFMVGPDASIVLDPLLDAPAGSEPYVWELMFSLAWVFDTPGLSVR